MALSHPLSAHAPRSQEKTASEKVTFNSTIYCPRELNEQKAATVRSCEKTEGEQFPIFLEKSCSNKKGERVVVDLTRQI